MKKCGHTKEFGMKTKEFNAWQGAKARCFNEKNPRYPDYGGRGITMAPVWVENFQAFVRHIGCAPSEDAVLDRIDNDGNYEPGNVRWTTPSESTKNQRQRRWFRKPDTIAA